MLGYLSYPQWLSPQIVSWLPIRWYGVMYLLAFIITFFLFRYEIRRREPEVQTEQILDLFFWTIVGLLIGGRVFATLVYADTVYYLSHPWMMFWPFDENMSFTGLQGMSYHGGLLGGVAGALIYTRRQGIDFIAWADVVACAAPLGYTLGRLGNFINGELYGRVTTVPWGMVFPTAQPVSTAHEWVRRIAAEVGMELDPGTLFVNLPRHPSQLYEAFFEGIVLWAIMWLVLRNRHLFRGALLGIYVIGYAAIRFVLEYFRQPDPGMDFVVRLSSRPNPPELFVSPLNLTMGQVLSLIMLAAGAVFLWIMYRRHTRRPTVQTLEPED
jgi:phosphatidylglycerol:prolipoprotein diacylglycerol transferase